MSDEDSVLMEVTALDVVVTSTAMDVAGVVVVFEEEEDEEVSVVLEGASTWAD